MDPEETPSTPPTEGQTVPPEEPAPQGNAQQEQAPPIQQAQSLARANPVPIGLAISFVAGVVFGRIASRRG